MTDVRALLRPRVRSAKPPRPASSFADSCHGCGHRWHGVGCTITGCGCPTAWTNPTLTPTEA